MIVLKGFISFDMAGGSSETVVKSDVGKFDDATPSLN
ncbi:Uncharacterised protein [Yersinia aldovae]|nr:Uncharacterised protein [Yersinia aldovae]